MQGGYSYPPRGSTQVYGAVRYPLPAAVGDARIAKTNVYGYLLGTVNPGGKIDFRFQQLDEKDVPAPVIAKFGQTLVDDCFAGNRQ